jgi:hypothetical protein
MINEIYLINRLNVMQCNEIVRPVMQCMCLTNINYYINWI